MHKIELHRRAQKGLRSAPEKRRNQIMTSLEELAATSNPSQHPNVKSMKGGMSNYHRMRVGNYRIIFEIVETQHSSEIKLLFVQNIDSRGNVY